MKKLVHYGPLFVIVAALLWSFDGLLRTSLYTLPSTVVVFYEHLIGAIVLLPFIKVWSKDLKKMTKKEWTVMSLVGLFSGALGTIFYTSALSMVQYVQFSVVVLLQQLQPIWAITAASLLLKERLSNKFILWAFVALIAAYLISFKNLQVNLATGTGTLMAAGLALGAGVLWGSSTALSKFVMNKVSFFTATALRFYIAPVFALLFVFGQGQSDALTSLSQVQIFTLLGITFSTGLVALGIYYYGLKRTPARIATLCELVWPASAVLIDYFYFNKGLTLTQILGIVLLGLSLYHVTKLTKAKNA